MLEENQLSGSIPPEIGNLTSLGQLDLSNNQLSGSIPPEMDNLAREYFNLYLGNNQLSGNIPPEMCRLYLNQAMRIEVDTEEVNLCK